ncbi:MAG: lipopolysaccharide heptosyltransferase II [Deltaproteobacteria bacterium]|nr:lipopolysaccharide heptosyltransferase II [Deltaproteobacteria bacterium]
MKALHSKQIKQILICSTNWVGDAIITTPAIRAVRKNFPEAKISLLAKPWVAPIFYNNPYIDNILIYDAAGKHKGLSGIPRLSKELRKKKFDLVILLQNAFKAAFIAFGAGIPNRLGYNTDARSLLLTHFIRLTPALKRAHQIDYYLGILKGASLKSDGRQLTLVVTDEERKHTEKILAKHGITEKDRLIGINPGAVFGSAKRWFPERYAALSVKLQKYSGARIAIFGGPGEKALGQYVSELMENHCVNFCGKTSLREAAALIERCQLFITNDSGLMHVAAALDTPQIAIFGSTDYVTTSPSSSKSQIIRVPVPCSPCLRPDCPVDHRCMKNITIDMVYDAAVKFLTEN